MESEKIDLIRRIMGTLPDEQPERKDEIYIGVKGIRVKLVDYPRNPYRAIYEVVSSTWKGEWWDKWEKTPVEGRVKVVLAALEGKTLPQCLEAPSFTWKIEGLSRSAYDQLARHRNSGIGSVGMRDNSWLDASLRIPSDLLPWKDKVESWWKQTKDLYEEIVKSGQSNWQSARFILPMGTCWMFTWTMNYRAFKEVCSQRLAFHEQFDTCATVWLMREELKKRFPLLAAYCRPVCDWARKCIYCDVYSLSIYFGALFKPCGRWPVKEVYATFPNQAAANPEEIERDLGIKIPKPDEWNKIVEEALKQDMRFFEGD
jgi:thymidylate synthase ThyX